jgi:hypothetical protein
VNGIRARVDPAAPWLDSRGGGHEWKAGGRLFRRKASTWTLVPDTGPIVGGLVSDGTTMFSSTCYFGDFCNPRYLRSPETDGQQWTQLKSPTRSQGGTMGYDKGHSLLYSSNLDAGLWWVVVH